MFIYGFIDEAVKRNPNFRIWFYGVALTKYYVSFNIQGDGRYVFPKINPDLVNDIKLTNNVVQSLHANRNCIFDCTTYAKAAMPKTTQVYQKIGSTFLTDGSGNRLYRTSSFSETYRGITHTWNLALGEVPEGIDTVSDERYAMYMPEWHIAMYRVVYKSLAMYYF